MRLIKANTNINFTTQGKRAAIISAVLVLIALATLAVDRLNLGIDFTGGVVIEVAYPEAVKLNDVRDALDGVGYTDAVVQNFGTASDVLIRLAPNQNATSADVSTKVLDALHAKNADAKMRRIEFIGPQVGHELVNKGGLALLYAMIGILIYVIVRFHWKLSVGSVLALFHDVIITLGIFSILQLQFDLTVLAALLAVIGYSLNDTIVVFDRIRENFRRMRKATADEVVNASINQMLARTLMTSGTTILTLLALFFLGGEALHGFATALLIGIFVGTYSSIYVASSLALSLKITKEDLFPPKEEEDAEKSSHLTR